MKNITSCLCYVIMLNISLQSLWGGLIGLRICCKICCELIQPNSHGRIEAFWVSLQRCLTHLDYLIHSLWEPKWCYKNCGNRIDRGAQTSVVGLVWGVGNRPAYPNSEIVFSIRLEWSSSTRLRRSKQEGLRSRGVSRGRTRKWCANYYCNG